MTLDGCFHIQKMLIAKLSFKPRCPMTREEQKIVFLWVARQLSQPYIRNYWNSGAEDREDRVGIRKILSSI